MLQLLDAPRSAWENLPKLVKLAGNFITHKDTDVGDEMAGLIGDCAESGGFLPLLGMGRDIPEGIDVPQGRRPGDRLEEERRLEGLLRARPRRLQGSRRAARRRVPRQPDLAAEPRRHRAPARRLSDGPRRARGRRRLLWTGLQLPWPAHRRRLGHARPGRTQPEPHDRRTRRPLRRRDARADERCRRARTCTADRGAGPGSRPRQPRRQ